MAILARINHHKGGDILNVVKKNIIGQLGAALPFILMTLRVDRILALCCKTARNLGARHLTTPFLTKAYRYLPFSAPLHIEILSRRLINKGRSVHGGATLGRVRLLFNWQAGLIASYLCRREKDAELQPESQPDTCIIFSRQSFMDVAEILAPEAVTMELHGFLFNPPGPSNDQECQEILKQAVHWQRYYKELIAWFGPDVEGDFVAWRGHPHMFLASAALMKLGHHAHAIQFVKSIEGDSPTIATISRGADSFLDQFERATGLHLEEADLPASMINRYYTSLPEIPIKRLLASTIDDLREIFLPRLRNICSGDILFIETPYHSIPSIEYRSAVNAAVNVLSILQEANFSIDVKRHPDYGDQSLLKDCTVASNVRYLPNGLPAEIVAECYDTIVFFYSTSLGNYTRGKVITLVEFLEGEGKNFAHILRGVEGAFAKMLTPPIHLMPDRYEEQLKSLFDIS
jgi:hypothetical protein